MLVPPFYMWHVSRICNMQMVILGLTEAQLELASMHKNAFFTINYYVFKRWKNVIPTISFAVISNNVKIECAWLS